MLYPQYPEFKTAAAYLKFKTVVSTADTGHEQAVTRGGAMAHISTTYNLITYDEAVKLRGFLAAHRGRALVFDLVVPMESHTQGDTSGSTPRVSAAAIAGSNSVVVKDLSANKLVRFAGEWLQFAGHSKAYMLTADLMSDASGNAVASFEPSLYEAVLTNEAVEVNEVMFSVRAKTDMGKFKLKSGKNYSFKIDFVEVVR